VKTYQRGPVLTLARYGLRNAIHQNRHNLSSPSDQAPARRGVIGDLILAVSSTHGNHDYVFDVRIEPARFDVRGHGGIVDEDSSIHEGVILLATTK